MAHIGQIIVIFLHVTLYYFDVVQYFYINNISVVQYAGKWVHIEGGGNIDEARDEIVNSE